MTFDLNTKLISKFPFVPSCGGGDRRHRRDRVRYGDMEDAVLTTGTIDDVVDPGVPFIIYAPEYRDKAGGVRAQHADHSGGIGDAEMRS